MKKISSSDGEVVVEVSLFRYGFSTAIRALLVAILVGLAILSAIASANMPQEFQVGAWCTSLVAVIAGVMYFVDFLGYAEGLLSPPRWVIGLDRIRQFDPHGKVTGQIPFANIREIKQTDIKRKKGIGVVFEDEYDPDTFWGTKAVVEYTREKFGFHVLFGLYSRVPCNELVVRIRNRMESHSWRPTNVAPRTPTEQPLAGPVLHPAVTPTAVPVADEQPLPLSNLDRRRFHHLVGGVLLVVAGVVIAIVTVILSLTIGSQGGSLVFTLGITAGGVFLSTWLLLAGRKMLARRAGDVLSLDSRPPILLLRSFGDDSSKKEMDVNQLMIGMTMIGLLVDMFTYLYRLLHDTGTFEEGITSMLSKHGPVIAIGRPGEQLPSLGAGRFWVSHDDWQQRVQELIGRSTLVVMIMGKVAGETGLAWEVNTIRQLGAEGKLILVAPDFKGEAEIEDIWTQYRELLGTWFPTYQIGYRAARGSTKGAYIAAEGKRGLAELLSSLR